MAVPLLCANRCAVFFPSRGLVGVRRPKCSGTPTLEHIESTAHEQLQKRPRCRAFRAMCQYPPVARLHQRYRTQAKAQDAVVRTRLQQREASEDADAGRVNLDDLRALMQHLQANRGNAAAVERAARRFRLPVPAVQQLAASCSIPAVSDALVGGEVVMLARWQ